MKLVQSIQLLTHMRQSWTLAKLIIQAPDPKGILMSYTWPDLDDLNEHLINCIQNPWVPDHLRSNAKIILKLKLKLPKKIRIFWPRNLVNKVKFQKDLILFCPNEVRYLMPETDSIAAQLTPSSLNNSMEAEEMLSARHRSYYRIYSPTLMAETYVHDTDLELFPQWNNFGRSIGFVVSPTVSLESIRLTLTLAPGMERFAASIDYTDWNSSILEPDLSATSIT
jgi:hypothetical protein